MTRRVLIVEDNEMNRDVLTRRLVRAGYQVSAAVDGLDGVAQASLQRPDIILMDVGLPGVDGFEATRRIKADPSAATIPIIALTAHAMAGDRERFLEAGMDYYLVKPIIAAELYSILKQIAESRKATRRAH